VKSPGMATWAVCMGSVARVDMQLGAMVWCGVVWCGVGRGSLCCEVPRCDMLDAAVGGYEEQGREGGGGGGGGGNGGSKRNTHTDSFRLHVPSSPIVDDSEQSTSSSLALWVHNMNVQRISHLLYQRKS